MNNMKTNIIGAIAVIALLLGAYVLVTQPMTTPDSSSSTTAFGAISGTNAPAANTSMSNGVLLPNPSVFDYVVARKYLYFDKALGFGNATSLAINMQGIRTSSFNTATITPCAVQNPFSATSTVQFTTNITTGTSSAAQLVVATAATQYATTTQIAAFAVSGGAQITYSTMGTTTTGTTAIVGPSQYVVLGTGTGSAVGYGYTYTGTCQGIFTTSI